MLNNSHSLPDDKPASRIQAGTVDFNQILKMTQMYDKSWSIRQTRPSFKTERRHTGFTPNNNLLTKRKATFPAIFFAIAFFLFGGLAPSAAFGQVVVLDNTTEWSNSSTFVGRNSSGGMLSAAQRFTTGTTVTSGSITVTLVMDSPVGASGGFTVQIWGEAGGQPDPSNVLATLSGNSNPSSGYNAYTGTVSWTAGQNLYIGCTSTNTSTTHYYKWRRAPFTSINENNGYSTPFVFHNLIEQSSARHLFSLTVPITLASCSDPTTLTATNVTATTADLGWTAGGAETAWEYVVQAAGGAAPTGAGTATSSNPTTATGLTAGTDYEFYVRADCGSGSYSAWVGPFAFSTAAAPTSNVVVLDNTSITSNVSNAVGLHNFFGVPSAAAARFTTGTAISSEAISVDLVMDNASGGPTSNSFTVEIWGESGGEPDASNIIATLSGNTNPATAGTYTYTGTATWSAGQNLYIVCTAPTETVGDWNWKYTGDLTITTTNGYTAQNRQYNGPDFGGVYYWGYGNNFRHLFSLTVPVAAPTCSDPTTLTATNVTTTTADLGWTAGGSETDWEYVVQAAGGAAPTGAGTATSSNPTTVTGLTAGTAYEFYVRADCGSSTYSAWVGPFAFNSAIPAFSTSGTSFENVYEGDIAFADIDNDGDKDVFITGTDVNGTQVAKLYTNDGSGNYSLVAGTPFSIVSSSAVAFADVDGDNDQDLLITGLNASFTQIAELYANNGSGVFSLVSGTPFDGVYQGSVAFSDVDNDGDQDVLITGTNTSFAKIAKLYTNDGAGTFSLAAGTPFSAVDNSSIAFADIDNNGFEDLLITGSNASFSPITQLYTNSSGTFTLVNGTPFDPIQTGSIAFADVDGNGYQDVLITGLDGSFNASAKLYKNNAGTFSLASGSTFDPVSGSGAVAFGDVDNDGDKDVVITGENASFTTVADVYSNDGTGTFTTVTGTPFTGVKSSAITFADVDNDGDEDVLITGDDGTGMFGAAPLTKLYLNITAVSCPAPAAMVVSNVAATTADLSWIGNGTATTWNLEWKAGANFTPGQGTQSGSASPTNTSYTVSGLTASTPYYLYYRSDCGSGENSGWVGPVTFTTIVVPLPVELTTFTAIAKGETVDLSWQTASEENNRGFEIERSVNGKDFETIGFVEGNGTTFEVSNYTFTDENPINGINYYRLKQLDFDGQFEYSKIVNCQLSIDNASLKVYPNPVQDELTISEGVGMITIYNALGQPVKQIINENQTIFAIDVRDLPKGIYSLQLRKANGEVVTTQFVK